MRQSDAIAQRRRQRILTTCGLSLAVLVIAAGALSVGQYSMTLTDVLRIIAAGPTAPSPELGASVLWQVRMPRIVLSLLIGAALAVSGAVMQALFANPLAEPGVIGVSSGAGVGAAIAIVSGLSFAGTFTVPLLAFVGAAATAWLVFILSRVRGQTQVVSLILTGIAVNAVAGAAISFLIFLAPTTAQEQIQFWHMGSLNGAQWKHVVTVLPVIILGIVLSAALSRQLDLLALGERAAEHVGVGVAKLRFYSLAVATMLTAAAVAFGGIIGFVGLIVPHLLRLVLGAGNRWLIPVSALGGAVLLSAADIVARTAIAYADLPIGIFTALVGGPVFFYLLRRTLAKGQHV